MKLCIDGEIIAAKCSDIVVYKDGEPTALYHHITSCDVCEALREQDINSNITAKRNSTITWEI